VFDPLAFSSYCMVLITDLLAQYRTYVEDMNIKYDELLTAAEDRGLAILQDLDQGLTSIADKASDFQPLVSALGAFAAN
jgi:hypothetical protein